MCTGRENRLEFGGELLAVATEVVEPAGQNGDGGGFEVDEFEAHANFGFDDADCGESLNAFAFALECDTSAGFHGKRLAGADETSAEREVRGDAFGASAGLEVEDLGVRGERIADSVTAIADAGFAWQSVRDAVAHGDNVAHCHSGRGRESQKEPDRRSPLSNKGARAGKK